LKPGFGFFYLGQRFSRKVNPSNDFSLDERCLTKNGIALHHKKLTGKSKLYSGEHKNDGNFQLHSFCGILTLAVPP
jgi:hypothetical protein